MERNQRKRLGVQVHKKPGKCRVRGTRAGQAVVGEGVTGSLSPSALLTLWIIFLCCGAVLCTVGQ